MSRMRWERSGVGHRIRIFLSTRVALGFVIKLAIVTPPSNPSD